MQLITSRAALTLSAGRPREENILLSSTLLCVCHGYSKLSYTINGVTRIDCLPVRLAAFKPFAKLQLVQVRILLFFF